MLLPQGPQTSGFDVLNSQKGSADDAVHVIKINRKIQDVGFQKMIQPTELTPEVVEDEVDNVKNVAEEKEEEVYIVPKEILDYLDVLIVKKKLPLRTLKFDIEFSKSKEEVARHLEEHSERINNIDPGDLDRMFALIGYGRDAVKLPVDTGVSNENIQDINPTQTEVVSKVLTKGESVTFPLKGENEGFVEKEIYDLDALRKNYVSLLVSFRNKSRGDQIIFRSLMSGLGSDRAMPQRPEPIELQDARKEYYEARKGASLHLSESITEQAVLMEEGIVVLSPNVQQKIRKATNLFNGYTNLSQLSEAIVQAEVGMIESIVDPNQFKGMRVDTNVETPKNEVLPQASQQSIDVMGASSPTSAPISAVLNPSESLVKKIAQTEIESELRKDQIEVIPRALTPVEVDIVQEPTNFIPQVEEKNPEKTEESKINGKNAETPPVDKTIAELPATPQNVFPTEFEDKILEVRHSFPGKPNEIAVFYDGIEIAVGEVKKDGSKIKVKNDFKSGFLLADTQEERALKHAMTIIKTIKYQK